MSLDTSCHEEYRFLNTWTYHGHVIRHHDDYYLSLNLWIARNLICQYEGPKGEIDIINFANRSMAKSEYLCILGLQFPIQLVFIRVMDI